MIMRRWGGLGAASSPAPTGVPSRPARRDGRAGRGLVALCASEQGQLRVVFVTTEVAPWSKVGGLADVLAALPAALAARGHSVMTVAPRYAPYEGVLPTGAIVPLQLPAACAAPAVSAAPQHPEHQRPRGRRRKANPAAAVAVTGAAAAVMEEEETGTAEGPWDEAEAEALASSTGGEQQQQSRVPGSAKLFHARVHGVDRVFVDHPLLRTPDIYGGASGASLTYTEAGQCSDLDLRYSILCQAALAAPVLLQPCGPEAGGPREGGVVFVANDWPTALLLLRLRHVVQRGAGAAQAAATLVAGLDREQLQAPDGVQQLEALMTHHLANAAAAFCIHNLAYQGVYSAAALPRLCLPPAALPALCTASDWRSVLAGREASYAASSEASLAEAETKAEVGAVAGAEAEAQAGAACAGGALNFMRAAILECDAVVTVSPHYADEVQAEEHAGCGLKEIIAAKGIEGIMNGLDVEEWDPEVDPLLPEAGRYTSGTMLAGKAHMKALVQRRLGLRQDPDAPLLVFVGRLTQQKGVDVLLGAAPEMLAGAPAPAPVLAPLPAVRPGDGDAEADGRSSMDESAMVETQLSQAVGDSSAGAAAGPRTPQLVVLGTGDAWMERGLVGLAQSFAGQAAGVPSFSEEMAHWLLAAADYCLVPSRFEPCGLVAQSAVRYGAVPIVAAVGGLKDLVTPDVGLTLPPLSPGVDAAAHRQDVRALAAAARRAAAECGGPRHRAMQRRCMELDLSWERPAEEWEALLRRLAHLRAP